MIHVEKEPDKIATAIRDYLWNNDEMIDVDPKPLTHPLAGHCYLASEAYYSLTGGSNTWTPQHLVVDWSHGRTKCHTPHWFLESRNGDRVVDLTAGQFQRRDVDIHYSDSTGKGFMPPTPSKRAKHVIESIHNDI